MTITQSLWEAIAAFEGPTCSLHSQRMRSCSQTFSALPTKSGKVGLSGLSHQFALGDILFL